MLPLVQEIKVKTCQQNLENILKVIKKRFQDRLSLAKEVLQLENGFSITNKKVLTTLNSFTTITFQDFSKVPSARLILQENFIDNSYIFYKATLQLSPAKLFAYIAVSPNYPAHYPLILVEFVYKTNYNALNSNGIRDLEKEINVFSGEPFEEEEHIGVLLRQIRKLFFAIEIFAHIEFPNEINVQTTYFREIQGRNRSRPYKYIPTGGGIYIHR